MITVKFNDESLLLDDGATVSCMLGKKSISAVNIAVAVNGQMAVSYTHLTLPTT